MSSRPSNTRVRNTGSTAMKSMKFIKLRKKIIQMAVRGEVCSNLKKNFSFLGQQANLMMYSSVKNATAILSKTSIMTLTAG